MRQRGEKSKSRINKVEVTRETLTSREGMAPFTRYIDKIGVIGLLASSFGHIRKSRKGAPVRDIFKQVLCFFYDGTSRHMAYFDELRADAGYAGVIESCAEEMVSSHQVKRFFTAVSWMCWRVFRAIIQLGGGTRSLDAIERVIKLGVRRVVLGTVAVEKPDIVSAALGLVGEERIAVAIDARDGMVHVRGWQENSGVSATGLALQMRDAGLRTVIFTDVSRDGLGSGLNVSSTRELAEVSGLEVIASGGVNTLEDVKAAWDANLTGVIIGRALYEGTINLRKAIARMHEWL